MYHSILFSFYYKEEFLSFPFPSISYLCLSYVGETCEFDQSRFLNDTIKEMIGGGLIQCARRLLFKGGGRMLGRVGSSPWVVGFLRGSQRMTMLSRRFLSVPDCGSSEAESRFRAKLVSSTSGIEESEGSQGRLDISNIQGTLDYGKDGLYVFSCVCSVCSNKITKKFSKKAYNEGIVIIRCDSCKNHHLVSDRLGWFGDSGENFDAFKLLNKEISIS